MSIFIDTSAILAVLDTDDKHHPKAKKLWEELLVSNENLVTSNYILLELSALVQNRLGLDALRVLLEDVAPVFHVKWVDETIHKTAQEALLTAGRRRLSLVDCVSFTIMRLTGVNKAFAFDVHFREQGFVTIS
jgi:predicted nucleic acid-binding protein